MATGLHVLALTPKAVVAFADLAESAVKGRFDVTVEGVPCPPPVLSARFDLADGGSRLLVAMRRPGGAESDRGHTAGGAVIAVQHRDGTVIAATTPCGDALPERTVPPAAAFEDLAPKLRVRMLRYLAEAVPGLLKLQDDPAVAALCRALAGVLQRRPFAIGPFLTLTGQFAYCRGIAQLGSLAFASAVRIGSRTVSRLRFSPSPLGPGPAPDTERFELVLERPAVDGDARSLLLLFDRNDRFCSALLPSAPDPDRRGAFTLIERLPNQADDPTRGYLLRCLAATATEDEESRNLAQHIVVQHPVPAQAVVSEVRPFGFKIDAAIPTLAGGLVVAGWCFDPLNSIAEVQVVSPSGQRRPLTWPPFRHPHEAARKALERNPHRCAERLLGFLAYADGFTDPIIEGQYCLEYRLKSGAGAQLVAPSPPLDPADRRHAVLGRLPAACLTDEVIERCLGPAIAGLHAACLAGPRVAVRRQYGTPPSRPAVSLVIPLYRALDLLRFQIAALALDPDAAAAEVILVLDSPEQAEYFDRLLDGIHLIYGVPLVVVVMTRNFGYAVATNTGAAEARGRTLVLLNSDVIPLEPGWLGTLAAALGSDPAIGAVGPKLLFEDHSLQHAGLYFGRDERGRWINRHYFKGYPGTYPPACRRRPVPGLTGACLMVDQALFAQVGGMTEDYVIGDYEDSDFSLKLDGEGRSRLYEPSAALYHFERFSIERHDGYQKSIACEYNRWLHTRRWQDRMAELMRTGGEPGPA